jgi:hypothetical protein
VSLENSHGQPLGHQDTSVVGIESNRSALFLQIFTGRKKIVEKSSIKRVSGNVGVSAES